MFTKWQLGQGRQRWAPNPQWWIRRRRWYADRGFIHGSMGESMMDLLDTWWYMGIEWNLMELGDYLSPCVFGLYDIEVWKWYISPIPTNDHDFCRWKTLIKLRYLGVYPIFNIRHRNQYCNRCGFILWLWLDQPKRWWMVLKDQQWWEKEARWSKQKQWEPWRMEMNHWQNPEYNWTK